MNRTRSMAKGLQLASHGTSIALEMALTPLCGYWMDQRWGYFPVLTILGAIIGFYAGFTHLLRLVDTPARQGGGKTVESSESDS